MNEDIIRVMISRVEDNICPRGCALMVRSTHNPEHVRVCPVCGDWNQTVSTLPDILPGDVDKMGILIQA